MSQVPQAETEALTQCLGETLQWQLTCKPRSARPARKQKRRQAAGRKLQSCPRGPEAQGSGVCQLSPQISRIGACLGVAGSSQAACELSLPLKSQEIQKEHKKSKCVGCRANGTPPRLQGSPWYGPVFKAARWARITDKTSPEPPPASRSGQA